MSKGKIIFSKNPVYQHGYKVEDPWKTVNGFLALKLELYGFIYLDELLLKKLMDKKKVVVETTDIPVENQFAVVGNRMDSLDYHTNNILEKINNGEDVWIAIELLPEFLKVKNCFEGVTIHLMDSYEEESYDNFSKESLSFLIGLFGKLYGRHMDKLNSKKLGVAQDLLYENRNLEKDLVLELIKIVENEKCKSKFDLPPINIFNKLIETLIIYKSIEF